jgi:Arc/MetJ-type ribon-helix-helix transcriptional regulator
MTLTLDAQLEQRIQRVQANGNYREPADVIDEALTLLEAEQEQRNELDARLEHSMAAARRGELYTPEEARQILADRRAARR